MRQFSDLDIQHIKNLTEYSQVASASIQDYLSQYYFTEEQNRALIIQNQGKYAVFFLSSDVFANEALKNAEINAFFELIELFKFLVQEGYMHIYVEKPEKMYFIQNNFNQTKILSNGTIILNAKGYFSSEPDTILDAQKNKKYKGMTFSAEQFQLILNHCIGKLVIDSSIDNLLAPKTSKSSTPEISNKSSATSASNTSIIAASSNKKNNPNNSEAFKKTSESSIAPKNFNNNRVQHFLIITSLLVSCSIAILLTITCFLGYEKLNHVHQKLISIENITSGVRDSIQPISENIAHVKKSLIRKPNARHSTDSVFYGIDISRWNGNEAADIPQIDSISFIICKATDGAVHVDPDLEQNWSLIKNNNHFLGVYHFYQCESDPILQAKHFVTTVSKLGSPDIAPIVDIEHASLSKNGNTDIVTIQRDLLLFLNYIKTNFKRNPIIYTGTDFAEEYLNNNNFNVYRLWLAEYTRAPKPRIPSTWKDFGYFIWQKKDNYFINSQPTDFDVFYGDINTLLQ